VVVKEVIQLENDLYAVHWEGDDDHCFNEMLNKYTDAEWLKVYFKDNKGFIVPGPNSGKYLEDMVYDTIDGIGEMSESIDKGDLDDLDGLFIPLGGNKANYYYAAKKYKGGTHFQWIRIYAIKDDQDCYFITGYACKFSQSMQGHDDTANELKKLQIADSFIKTNKLNIP